MNGKFITIEGIEGVGKSSNIKFIANMLQSAGKSVVLTREPGGTPIAEAIRQVLLHEYVESTLPQTELLLLYAGRLQHVEHVIKPALAQGKWVVSDRFVDATYAYQGAGRGVPIEKIDTLNSWVLGEFVPDCTIVLDATVEVAFSRISSERTLDRFEKEQKTFFEKIRAQYLSMAKKNPHRYHVIDASKPLEAVQQALQEVMSRFLQNHVSA
jgi:dTMP kinase